MSGTGIELQAKILEYLRSKGTPVSKPEVVQAFKHQGSTRQIHAAMMVLSEHGLLDLDLNLHFSLQEVTLQKLKADLPLWRWQAVHKGGLGWTYKGSRGNCEVEVRQVAVVSGSSEDNFSTDWWVYPEGVSYNSWRLINK